MIGSKTSDEHSENESANGNFHDGVSFLAHFSVARYLLSVESARSSRLTGRNRHCAVAGYHGGVWGRCDGLRGQHMVGSESSDQHSENEGADGKFHGRVSFSYYLF